MSLSCVLVIDDSKADHLITKHIIHKYDADIEVLQARDGMEAIGVLELVSRKPDLILLDVNMPRMDGYEFLRIYCEEFKGEVPVVIMLGTSLNERDNKKTKDCDCVKSWIVKPLLTENMEELSKLVT